MVNWRLWLIRWISIAEALFFMTVRRITIEGILIAKQLTVWKKWSPSTLHHLGERHILIGLIFSLTIINSTEAVTKFETSIIGTVLGWWKWIWSHFSYTIALVSTSWDTTGLIKSGSIASHISSCTLTSIEDSNKIVMHGTEAISLFTKMNWAETRAALTLICTLNSLEAVSQNILALCWFEITCSNCRRSSRNGLWGRSNRRWWFPCGRVSHNWTISWRSSKLFERIIVSIKWSSRTKATTHRSTTSWSISELFEWIGVSIKWTFFIWFNLKESVVLNIILFIDFNCLTNVLFVS